MEPRYQQMLFELQTNIEKFETDITQYIIDIMIEKNYIKFHKDGTDWVYEDMNYTKYPAEANVQQPLDEYYDTLDRPDIVIDLE